MTVARPDGDNHLSCENARGLHWDRNARIGITTGAEFSPRIGTPCHHRSVRAQGKAAGVAGGQCGDSLARERASLIDIVWYKAIVIGTGNP